MKANQNLRQAIDLLYAHGHAANDAYAPLLHDCIRTSNFIQAKRLESHMDLHSFKPSNTYLYNRLLHLYAKCGQLSTAHQLFDKMPQRDVLSFNAMLFAYAKLGLIDHSLGLFNRMPVRDCVSYNTVIAGLTNNGYCVDALEFFIRMRRDKFEPTDYTYVSVLNACTQLIDLKRGKQIHGFMTASDLRFNVFVWNALMDMYAKCNDIEDARKLFDDMPDRNVVSWNSMIMGYLRNGQTEKCMDLFNKMRVTGIEADLVTFSTVLGACFQRSLIEEAKTLFREMKNRDGVCWTAMIVGHVKSKREDDALVLYNEMLSDGIRPDSFTMSSVVSACAGLASLDHGKSVHGQLICFGIESDLLVSTSLVDMYSKCGEITDAQIVFKIMPNRNVISWNAMIIGYAQNGWDREALVLYEKMLKENLKPDTITFVGVLSACGHACLIEEGWRYFSSISKLHGISPTLDHYSCMINLVGRSGKMNEAVDLIKSMPYEPNCLIWSTLLSVSRINRDVEHGEMAAKRLFELDPTDAGPYIMLSNMYASLGRWKDVASIRSLMKERKIRKFAAYSWIEISNKVHKFVSDDRSHNQTDKIYKELRRLMLKLWEEGFVPDTSLVLHDVGEKEKIESIRYHSEKLALAFGLIAKPQGTPIRIVKNIRVCGDCHLFMKFVSNVTERHIILRDSNRFHHFVRGECSCKDYW